MTAVGAMSEGLPEPTDADVDALSADDVAAYGEDVRRWLVGPYTGASRPDTLRWRALALTRYAERHAHAASGTGPPAAIDPEPLPEQEPSPAPGSSDDPAYSSPTPVAGPSGLESPGAGSPTSESEQP